MTSVNGPARPRHTFILCLDGTGNRFTGTASDSNILKIFRMLDFEAPNTYFYYQPGIGTYVSSKSYTHNHVLTKTKSWIDKTRDAMIGSSFDQHVMAGYKFLMRYYESGDDIYLFGFSRGAYTARFLAEMLDTVGLLTKGNEEMARFAWKAFAAWQRRLDGTAKERAKKQEMLRYVTAFRETFSRPVRRIRFMGLFDTVNSVPAFETAFLERSKFPYSARSSALIIRHAVSIDERRAKFRSDLISEKKGQNLDKDGNTKVRPLGLTEPIEEMLEPATKTVKPHSEDVSRFRRKGGRTKHDRMSAFPHPNKSQQPQNTAEDDDVEAEENMDQDIKEMWFPGGHGDLGGGWTLGPGEDLPLSHIPLVWIVREAMSAGLTFDEDTLKQMHCYDDQIAESPSISRSPTSTTKMAVMSVPETPALANFDQNTTAAEFRQLLQTTATKSVAHDCLIFGGGLSKANVLAWWLLEIMPSARMDLQSDGSWRRIRWPIPRGEVRDIPDDAIIHCSAIQRLRNDKTYRPGNLIMGGGGRGRRTARKSAGIGDWVVAQDEGDHISEGYRRVKRPSPTSTSNDSSSKVNEKK